MCRIFGLPTTLGDSALSEGRDSHALSEECDLSFLKGDDLRISFFSGESERALLEKKEDTWIRD